MPIIPTSSKNIHVGYISKTSGYVKDLTISEAFDYEKLRVLLRYMNRVTGYYAFQESRFLNKSSSINEGVSQNQ